MRDLRVIERRGGLAQAYGVVMSPTHWREKVIWIALHVRGMLHCSGAEEGLERHKRSAVLPFTSLLPHRHPPFQRQEQLPHKSPHLVSPGVTPVLNASSEFRCSTMIS